MSTENQEQAGQEQPTSLAAEDNKIIAERRAKLAAIREKGIAFPNDFVPQHKAADLTEQFGGWTREQLEAEPQQVVLAGRMMLKREAGKKAAFATLQDSSGPRADGRIQIYVTLDNTGEEAMEALRHYDLGDILGVVGTLFKTKTDELTVKVTTLRLITKALRPLPDKFHGLADQENMNRLRYVDLIIN
jgi:lysyl-tRNA synthetase class 2